jgi:hypothetical protein
VLGLLAEAGSTGLTWFELGDKMRWHHGQSSNALSVLHKDDAIAALMERRGRAPEGVEGATSRGKSTIYVLKEYVLGRPTRDPGATRGNRELADANVALDRENALLNQRIVDLQATLRERDETLAQRESEAGLAAGQILDLSAKVRTVEQQLALAGEFQARLDDERARMERGYQIVKGDLEQAQREIERLERMTNVLRVRRALAELSDEERALHERVGAKLAGGEIAAAPDDMPIRVTLGAIRSMWMAMGRLRPEDLPRRARGRSPVQPDQADPADQTEPADQPDSPAGPSVEPSAEPAGPDRDADPGQ